MASDIDSGNPVAGTPTTLSVRNNFSFAEAEIDELHRATEDSVTAGGTLDALTANFTKDVVLAEGVTVVVLAAGANTITTPTLDVDGTGVKTIVKGNGVALLSGDIIGNRHYLILRFDNTNSVWVLMNPGITAASAPLASPTFTGDPKAPTPTASDNDTSIATTAYVQTELATQGAKAWVNFNGTGTPTIRDQFNVASITDNGPGDYTINFTTALANANFAAVVSANVVGNITITDIISLTTSSVKVSIAGWSGASSSSATFQDATIVCVVVFGD